MQSHSKKIEIDINVDKQKETKMTFPPPSGPLFFYNRFSFTYQKHKRVKMIWHFLKRRPN